MATPAVPNIFERYPNVILVNTSRFQPQTTYEKIMIVWMIFGSKLLSRFSISGIYSFLKYLHDRQTQTSSGSDENVQLRFGSPRRDPCMNGSQTILWGPLGYTIQFSVTYVLMNIGWLNIRLPRSPTCRIVFVFDKCSTPTTECELFLYLSDLILHD